MAMSQRFINYFAALLLFCVLTSTASADQPPTYAGKTLPKPDLATLAERCHPDTPYDENSTAFEELLYLRERPNPKALGVLKQILEQSRPNKRIIEFAALQALYTLNTKASLALLDETMKDPVMFGQTLDLIHYARTWEMDPRQAAGLITDYCLEDQSGDLNIEIGLHAETAKGGGIGIDIAYSSSSEKGLTWTDTRYQYLASGLLLRDKQGNYHLPRKGRAYDALTDYTETLTPGRKTVTRRIVMYAFRQSKDVQEVRMSAMDMEFNLPANGEYEAVFIMERPIVSKEQQAAWAAQGKVRWSGRAVSNAIKFTVRGKLPDVGVPLKPGAEFPFPVLPQPQDGK